MDERALFSAYRHAGETTPVEIAKTALAACPACKNRTLEPSGICIACQPAVEQPIPIDQRPWRYPLLHTDVHTDQVLVWGRYSSRKPRNIRARRARLLRASRVAIPSLTPHKEDEA